MPESPIWVVLAAIAGFAVAMVLRKASAGPSPGPGPGPAPRIPYTPSEQVHALVARRRAIEAIRLIRRESGLDLKASKAVYELLLRDSGQVQH